MKILLAGGTGFVGSNLIRLLVDKNHQVTLISRRPPGSKAAIREHTETIVHDPSRPLADLIVEADAIINLVGIIREFPSRGITFEKAHFEITKSLADSAQSRGITRFLQMSALGVGADGKTGYARSKFKAEEYLRSSKLRWTIFRPSMIFGPGDRVTGMFSRMIRYLPAVPVIGDGQYKLQPVHVDDVCTAFVKALDDDRSIDKVFEFGGPEILSFNRMLDILGEALGKKKVRKIHAPVGIMRMQGAVWGRFPWFPITNEQITMLLDDNHTDDTSLYDLFDFRPRTFAQGLAEYLK
jgi:nucleoside-diphosphate-sugar epimerase